MPIQKTPTAAGSLPVNGVGSHVYLAYSDAGELLYVGLADDIAWRLAGHRRDMAPWHYLAAKIDWETYPDRASAAAAERRHIRELHPRFNVVHRAKTTDQTPKYPVARRRRLGDHVRDRRTELKRSQRSMARDAAMAASSWRHLEAGELDDLTPALLARIESALRWQEGSARSVLAGGASEEMTDAAIGEAALAAYPTVIGVTP